MSSNIFEPLVSLERKIQTLLPAEYQDSYESLEPVPMRSTGLKYDRDGNVAWDEIWSTFCDLAMAGGPPHKGTLLEPGSRAAIDAQPEQYAAVAEEICRGIILATGLTAQASPMPGWVRVGCFGETMAAWLLRAITTENVAVRGGRGMTLDLPAAPHFRLEKEIKNVITVIAKTCHYWMGHTPPDQRQAIASLLAAMEEESPLVEPMASSDGVPAEQYDAASTRMADAIVRDTALRASDRQSPGWLGLECANARTAIWMMRALVASNVLSRREGVVLFVPVNPIRDPQGTTVADTVGKIARLATARGLH
jgi:sirohydrochlorin cobaltochelatase